MTSQDKTLSAFSHSAMPQIPVDFGGHRSSGIMALAYRRLKDYLGIGSGHIYVYDIVQQLAIVEPEVLDRLGVDTIEAGRAFLTQETDWQDWELPGGIPCKIPAYLRVEKMGKDWYILNEQTNRIGVMKAGCLYFEQVIFPWEREDIFSMSFDELEVALQQIVWCAAPSPGAHLNWQNKTDLEQLSSRVAHLRETTQRAVIGLFGGNMFELPQWLFRMDHYLLNLAQAPERIWELNEKLCRIHLKNLEKFLAAMGNNIDVIVFGDDLGSQVAPLISPKMYRELIQPFHRKLFQYVKKHSHAKINLHSCGAIAPLLDDLIDAGLDAVNPVQISCGNMDAAALKQQFGERLVFWGGGCDTRQMLPEGSPAAIREHVLRQLAVMSQSGGFVFQQVHNIMSNVPPENIVAMFQAVEEFNRTAKSR